ncbi:hypothetical protein LTR56_024063 [Elasticomyces elasticus]|nr:hypothetical protein LTR56_024063 [Elasticomyces elasticus]KAK3666628.1 hypothetical protein LTR22_002572 [Elasticomyces elasticus]KAK4921679.1 hypothetical protein LTR49_010970 [Elasticomyces elasticus]KAK5758623.1 hypothetical protein LTS12_011327 [Elasticomyces elasticus]
MAYEFFAVALLAVLLLLIKRDIKKMIKATLAETQRGTAQHLSFDIRAQILTNAQILWILTRHNIIATTANDSKALDKQSPKMDIMLSCCTPDDQPVYTAEVIIFGWSKDDHTHKVTFVTSGFAWSAEGALRDLLQVTAIMAGQERMRARVWWAERTGFDAPGGGKMWLPSQKCDSCMEGMKS